MRKLTLPLILLTAMARAQQAEPVTLHIGDPAPPVTVEKWLAGSPVTKYFSSQSYVVVFWATWCSAFIPIIPHLTDLQNQYSGKVHIAAISVMEKSQARANDYVTRMAGKIKFSVAIDQVPANSRHGMDGAMATSWLKASNQLGIPVAFIVDPGGKIAWIGSPVGNQMDEPLRKIVNGTWDTAAFAQKFNSEQDRQKTINDI